MTFFITSEGPGKGGDLGGLAGADAHCARLATAAGTTGKTWRAYLSTQGANAVNAKDRIGKGPWQNAKGTVVAASVADLHSANNKLNKENSLSEKGAVINGRGDKPNRHDILTGSQADGTRVPRRRRPHLRQLERAAQPARRWSAIMTGTGSTTEPPMLSWNSSHPSRGPGGGCAQTDLRGTGGDGLFYCLPRAEHDPKV